MKASRLAAWLFGAAVCGAWLASAAGVTWQARAPRIPPRPADLALDALAADVQSQAGRLRDRLAGAPSPAAVDRNPFSFASRPTGVPRPAPTPPPAPVAAVPEVAEVREPSIALIGVAEAQTAAGLVRTAMLDGGASELIMGKAGEVILDRYEIVTVGADAVELKDRQTGAVRRLVLQ